MVLVNPVVGKMLIVAVVIASFVVLSSANMMCNTTNSTVPASCRNASMVLRNGPTNDTQRMMARMMVCNASDMCYRLLQNVTVYCGNMVSNQSV